MGGKRTIRSLAPAERAFRVQMPIIPTVAGWIAETPGTISLGQGVVHYGPPPAAVGRIPAFLANAAHHKYLPDAGIPALRKAFQEKLRAENGIDAPFDRRIFVTAGANQGFLNALLCLCDPGDEVILLSPYYFNHEMAVGLAGCRAVCVPTDRNYQPRLAAIRAAITPRTRAVVTVSPNNPAGVVYSRDALLAINRLCADRGIYHISDEAYEYFTYDGAEHFSPAAGKGGEHTISLFSMSKSYGMASWRVGFLVVPEHLFDDMMKVQDTVIICAPAVSQAVALGALAAGRRYCLRRLPAIAGVRRRMLAAFSRIADLMTVPPSQGAFYFLVRVHTSMDDLALARRLIREHRVAVIPGGTFGIEKGCYLRISYGNLPGEEAIEGANRLVAGLKAVVGG
ncbi:MAG TPA: pyridoxal phosphate-dependent aminotransferase [Candidatus Deferrimicrobiaceae bacterium]|nr:pyridoxal phosphate-dependent aminotransferase [Candidatus Deferrimicrobiaceae bacterium]